MLKGRKHLYHLVNPSARPFLAGWGAFFLVSGFIFYINNISVFFLGDLFFISLILLVITVVKWFEEIIKESTFDGYHTLVVQRGLKRGFLLFIVSEVMLFFGFFWAFFHAAFYPDIVLGGHFPPSGIVVIAPFEIPLFNTFLLILSGFIVTWTHKAIIYDFVKDVIDSLILTIFCGFFFLILQLFEYYESYFSFFDSVYSCSFFMLTGLHGMHVLVGVIFLFTCLCRFCLRHFTIKHHLGFVFAVWYWHFVDIVWFFFI